MRALSDMILNAVRGLREKIVSYGRVERDIKHRGK
jgi:hypothetical protein